MNRYKKKKLYASRMAVLSAAVLAGMSMPVGAAETTAADTVVQTKDVIVTATKTEAEVQACRRPLKLLPKKIYSVRVLTMF